MIEVDLQQGRLLDAMRQIEWAVGDTRPLMRGFAGVFAAITEENLENEGQSGYDWPSLSEVTTAIRAATGHWPGQMLQVSSALARGVTTDSDDVGAWIGVGDDVPQAAMMHFGGKKDRFPHLWGDIPARPYLPMDADGKLQPEAEEDILALALGHIAKAARL